MKLSSLKINDRAVITSVKCTGALRARLNGLGFVKGQSVICTNISAFGALMAFSVQGSKIAVRKSCADRIGVRL
ncbi:MAG: ferrous iron transport protein A [Eubacterium sp.]|nr:ferrous iron transport protein A [Eubacterium sp.]